jgi:NADH-quinone oxidoreductase subunit L
MMMSLDLLSVFLPLAGFLVAGLFGRRLGDVFAAAVTCLCVLGATACAAWVFYDVAMEGHVHSWLLAPWIASGNFSVNWGLRIDTLAAVMILVVNFISAMVHLYSIGYMHGDKGFARFMAYLSLFTFFMLMLVSGDNLLQMFFGWEGVGLMSYLLIGFWYERPAAAAASIKAFLVNRAGDLGFLMGILGCFVVFGSVQFDRIFKAAPAFEGMTFQFLTFEVPVLTTLCLLLFVGAMAKSAQLGLHTWLPDAMEGPTPVSALIHAATMVTAGVFMVARLSPLFEFAPDALAVIAVVGAITAFFAATIGLVQNDIKRVIAYSTISQLGYMFFALGVSAYAAAVFHLMTHAFFKALLFLGAGSVIHALSGEQDMRKMGGLWKKTPVTYVLMWIGSLALAGVGIDGLFGFAGFYSKDLILESALVQNNGIGHFAYFFGLISAFMTAFYSWRLIIMTFHGKPKTDGAHESSWVMLVPLLPLALGSIFAGYFAENWFVGAGQVGFWHAALMVLPQHDAMDAILSLPEAEKCLPLVFAASGILFAYLCYMWMPWLPSKIAEMFGVFYRIVLNKYYFDEVYDFLFVRPAHALGRILWKFVDGRIIDGLGPDGAAWLSKRVGGRLSKLQTGFVYHYALAMVAGLAVFVAWIWLRG